MTYPDLDRPVSKRSRLTTAHAVLFRHSILYINLLDILPVLEPGPGTSFASQSNHAVYLYTPNDHKAETSIKSTLSR